MTSSNEILSGMASDNPESVRVLSVCLETCSLVQIPHTNCLIFTVAEDDVITRMESTARDVVEMAAE